MSAAASLQLISFGPFEFDPAAGLLYHGDEETLLPPKAAGVLRVLLENSAQLVTKDELLEEVWAGAYVTESSLTDAISLLRRVLGDDSRDPIYIQTLHRRGYRFIAPVEQQVVSDDGVDTPSVEPSGEARAGSTGSWAPGHRLGNYEILDTLGAGAMGTVYRARDESLEREVAIKALPADFTDDPESVARLEREAKLLASVSHPNIAAIHSLEESDGIRFPVFELVEGETLEQRLRSGRLPVDEALELGRQIASALEAAHERGIIHRDLKPANIKVTPDGQVKVLDFGLAKALEVKVFDGAANARPTESIAVVGTRRGSIVGTVAYMSPEQARGEEVDKRADIWSFGSVLYELLMGRRPFEGETVSDTIAGVLEREPDWDALPSETPALVRSLLRRLLQKDPADRLHDIADARIEIEEAISEPARALPGVVAVEVQPPLWRRALPWTVAGIAIAALAASLGVWISSSPSGEIRKLEITLPPGDQLGGFTLSPDGRSLVYSASRSGEHQLFRRHLDQLHAEPIDGTEGGYAPFVWPDGEWVSFGIPRPWGLKKVRLSGGVPIHLADLPDSVSGTAWEPPGHLLVGSHVGNVGLLRLSTTPGEPAAVTRRAGETTEPHRYPHMLPGGRGVLFTVGVGRQIALLESGSTDWRILEEGGDARYAPTGHLVFGRGGNLWAAPFDLDQLEFTGEAVPVVRGVEIRNGKARFAMSADGSLFYQPAKAKPDRLLVWVDRHGVETPLSRHAQPIRVPIVSPDGKTLLVRRQGVPRFWLHDIERDMAVRLTENESVEWRAAWSPDGASIAYTSRLTGVDMAYRVPLSGSREPQPIGIETSSVVAWTAGGLVSWTGGALQLWSFSEERNVVLTEEVVLAADVSVDGKYLAYIATENDREILAVRRVAAADGRRWLVTSEERLVPSDDETVGKTLAWSIDGGEVFYRSGSAMMAVRVEESDGELSVGEPTEIFRGPYDPEFDVAPDGRFVMARNVAPSNNQPPDRIIVVLNWFEELKRLVPRER